MKVLDPWTASYTRIRKASYTRIRKAGMALATTSRRRRDVVNGQVGVVGAPPKLLRFRRGLLLLLGLAWIAVIVAAKEDDVGVGAVNHNDDHPRPVNSSDGDIIQPQNEEDDDDDKNNHKVGQVQPSSPTAGSEPLAGTVVVQESVMNATISSPVAQTNVLKEEEDQNDRESLNIPNQSDDVLSTSDDNDDGDDSSDGDAADVGDDAPAEGRATVESVNTTFNNVARTSRKATGPGTHHTEIEKEEEATKTREYPVTSEDHNDSTVATSPVAASANANRHHDDSTASSPEAASANASRQLEKDDIFNEAVDMANQTEMMPREGNFNETEDMANQTETMPKEDNFNDTDDMPSQTEMMPKEDEIEEELPRTQDSVANTDVELSQEGRVTAEAADDSASNTLNNTNLLDKGDQPAADCTFYCGVWGKSQPERPRANISLLLRLFPDLVPPVQNPSQKSGSASVQFPSHDNNASDKPDTETESPLETGRPPQSSSPQDANKNRQGELQEQDDQQQQHANDNSDPVKRSANSAFAEGLDDIDKFFEDVDPPDELDIGAGGTSIQEVLMGQGSQIIRKRIMMGLKKARHFTIQAVQELWQASRTKLREARRPEKEDFDRAVESVRSRSQQVFQFARQHVRRIWEEEDILSDTETYYEKPIIHYPPSSQRPQELNEPDQEAIRRLMDKTLR